MISNFQKIAGNSHEGDFVLQQQTLAADESFRNVSKAWYAKTLSFEDGFHELADGRSRTQDLFVPFERMLPTVAGNGDFCLEHSDGRQFFPTEHAVRQLGTLLGTGTTYPVMLLKNQFRHDADALAYAFEHAWNKVEAHKRFRFRIRNATELRAVTSERFDWLRNEWYLHMLKKAVPSGRLSHWRGDSDTIWGNILVSDTIRAEQDSEYGAMVSVSNCEIGKRKPMQQPSLFRAICMNGCIWGKTRGETLVLKRRGKIDMDTLGRELIENIRKQIPLALSGVDRLLKTRTFESDIAMKPVIAQVCKDFRMTKTLATSILDSWHIERQTVPDSANSLFAVINSVTRSGQQQDNETWVKFDELGGRLLAFREDDWSSLLNRASKLKLKSLEATFASAV